MGFTSRYLVEFDINFVDLNVVGVYVKQSRSCQVWWVHSKWTLCGFVRNSNSDRDSDRDSASTKTRHGLHVAVCVGGEEEGAAMVCWQSYSL